MTSNSFGNCSKFGLPNPIPIKAQQTRSQITWYFSIFLTSRTLHVPGNIGELLIRFVFSVICHKREKMDSDGLPIVGPNVDFTKVMSLWLYQADTLMYRKKLINSHAYDFRLICCTYSPKALDVLELFTGWYIRVFLVFPCENIIAGKLACSVFL